MDRTGTWCGCGELGWMKANKIWHSIKIIFIFSESVCKNIKTVPAPRSSPIFCMSPRLFCHSLIVNRYAHCVDIVYWKILKLRQETREVDSWSGVPTWNKPPLNIDLAWLPAGEGRLGRFMFCDITMAVIVNTEADTFHGYNRYYMDINHE